jgi:hypothetical protein
MSIATVPVFAGADRSSVTDSSSVKRTLRRTRRWSWMASGWFEPFNRAPDGGGTACMTLGCSDDFVAVRLGFPNVTAQPWRITRAIARPSDSFNDYVTPPVMGHGPRLPQPMPATTPLRSSLVGMRQRKSRFASSIVRRWPEPRGCRGRGRIGHRCEVSRRIQIPACGF